LSVLLEELRESFVRVGSRVNVAVVREEKFLFAEGTEGLLGDFDRSLRCCHRLVHYTNAVYMRHMFKEFRLIPKTIRAIHFPKAGRHQIEGNYFLDIEEDDTYVVKTIEGYETRQGRLFRLHWEAVEPDLSEIDPKIVAAIKSRDGRTDRYGDDLVFTVLHDLCDDEYVARWMPDHKAGCDAFRALDENERERIVRLVCDEPKGKWPNQ
jgi:hypothetical protein